MLVCCHARLQLCQFKPDSLAGPASTLCWSGQGLRLDMELPCSEEGRATAAPTGGRSGPACLLHEELKALLLLLRVHAMELCCTAAWLPQVRLCIAPA